jgi:hypothetical protein
VEFGIWVTHFMGPLTKSGKGGVGKAGLTADESLPFPLSMLGTYSCHGIEPKFNRSGFSVKAKINQDRGGIQYPFGGRRDVAFLCVMVTKGSSIESLLAPTVEPALKDLPIYITLLNEWSLPGCRTDTAVAGKRFLNSA